MGLSKLLLTVALVPIITIFSARTNPNVRARDTLENQTVALNPIMTIFSARKNLNVRARVTLENQNQDNEGLMKPGYDFQNNASDHTEIPLRENKDVDEGFDSLFTEDPDIESKYHLDTLNGYFEDFFFKAHFKAKNIDIMDVRTTKRKGPILVGADNQTARVQIFFGFEKLLTTVEKITVALPFITLHGSVMAEARNNSFLADFQVVRKADGHCDGVSLRIKPIEFEYNITAKLSSKDETSWLRKTLVKMLENSLRLHAGKLISDAATRLFYSKQHDWGIECEFFFDFA